MQKLYMLKKKGTIDVIPIYEVPELDAIIGELYINHVVKVNGAVSSSLFLKTSWKHPC